MGFRILQSPHIDLGVLLRVAANSPVEALGSGRHASIAFGYENLKGLAGRGSVDNIQLPNFRNLICPQIA